MAEIMKKCGFSSEFCPRNRRGPPFRIFKPAKDEGFIIFVLDFASRITLLCLYICWRGFVHENTMQQQLLCVSLFWAHISVRTFPIKYNFPRKCLSFTSVVGFLHFAPDSVFSAALLSLFCCLQMLAIPFWTWTKSKMSSRIFFWQKGPLKCTPPKTLRSI